MPKPDTRGRPSAMATKRKASAEPESPPPKRPATAPDIESRFRPQLFTTETFESHNASYHTSQPFKHGVIPSLIDDTLLRSVRSEITTNISFTPKETDIYKIYQSGDLANLDGLDSAALDRLPSLVKLRDALYSRDFREYLSGITGAGKLSGKKTDMAVNVYTPGCHLLCHDDVIGSRRVSYILYLTDPDKPWRPEWGGALRLYPMESKEVSSGDEVAIPGTEHSRSVPPAFGQLSFFAVQPGTSYHDVEEVHARGPNDKEEEDGGRVRMAISGWYHIPQEGEEGYEEGAEEKQAQKSSRAQLQGKADKFEEPKPHWTEPPDGRFGKYVRAEENSLTVSDVIELSEKDLDLLIKYMNPRYLTPDTVSSLRESFTEDSSLRLAQILSPKYAPELHELVRKADDRESDDKARDIWATARPPHKHRYLYSYPTKFNAPQTEDLERRMPIWEVLQELIPSLAFRKWLCLATGLRLGEFDVLARRFRRGQDYSLATSYNEEEPQLEVCLGLTPTDGWGANAVEETEGEGNVGEHASKDDVPGTLPDNSGVQETPKTQVRPALTRAESSTEDTKVGGYEAYLAGDDDDDTASVDAPANPSTATGAGQRRSGKADPAVYQAYGEQDEEDDGVLFNQPASWNTLTIVLRDKGTMRFVKYVSRSAPGDRWDISAAWKVTGSLDDDEDEDENDDDNDDDDGEDEHEGEIEENEEDEAESGSDASTGSGGGEE
ncbi:MAG: hypothetical protein Q9159_006498 [Coniocarpon cinnabarinum]